MNKSKEKVLSTVRKAVDKIAEHEAEEWPPVCWGQYYQLQRPTQFAAKAKSETFGDE